EADVLCIGGGPAGLCAAIRASEQGAEVVVVDKSHTLRSGDAGMGNDHFMCHIPDVQGERPDFFNKMGNMSQVVTKTFWENAYGLVKLWDSWGIPMKYEGRYEFAGHSIPGQPNFMLHFSGQNTKVKLTKQAKKAGVNIINRVMILDLIHDNGTIAGAIGFDVRKPRLLVFKTKAVILGTGKCMRLFPQNTGSLFNTSTSPVNTGDGRAMAYRAGCELSDMELNNRWSGPKYFARNGRGSWTGVFRDPHGMQICSGKELTAHFYPELHEDYQKSGRGPVYMDLAGISDEHYEDMKYWLIHEANTPILNFFKEEGVDPREHPFEFMTYGLFTPGGINYNEKCETPLSGLYAAGDEFMSFYLAGAAVFGSIAGESAAKFAAQAKASDIEGAQALVGKVKELLEEVLNRTDGATWQEANSAIQQVMADYCGLIRSETLLTAGLEHLRRLKKKVPEVLMAQNPHELMRCIEVLNLFDLGEITFVAAKERKESRQYHRRVDFPFTNPILNEQMLVVKNENGQPVPKWRMKA
ncbi:MAG: FAD-binding protein, partial [Deltaproteobacteria bacterium]|nr:FAD-binding protein [Deltaproteobacteria bacterium]